MTGQPLRITDEQIVGMPLGDVVWAVNEAYRALGRGHIVNATRKETLGRPGDPDFFHLELSAEQIGPGGKPLMRCRKVIEEAGSRDALGERAPGVRRAWIELEDLSGGATATLDAEAITDLRTGVSALLAGKYLVPEGPVNLAVIGTGRIGRAVALAAPHVFTLESVRVTSRQERNRRAFVEAVRPFVPCEAAETIPEATRGADLVVAAVPATEPVLSHSLTADARHVTLVGGDPRVVLGDRTLWTNREAIPDDGAQADRSGDVIRAHEEGWSQSIHWLSTEGRRATVADAALGRLEDYRDRPTLALLTGLAALDLAVARLAWERITYRKPHESERNRR